jgi:hypothetical protein
MARPRHSHGPIGLAPRREGRDPADEEAYGATVESEWPERDSREWLLGPRGAVLEPWEEAAAHLPGVEDSLAAVLCVPQTPPTIWMHDAAVDDLTVWDAIQAAVKAYDAGDRDPGTWREVLGGEGHLAVLARP